jgi:hypothetical protein
MDFGLIFEFSPVVVIAIHVLAATVHILMPRSLVKGTLPGLT